MSTFKPIPSDSYHVRPIVTHKRQSFSLEYSGSIPTEGVFIGFATIAPNIHEWNFDPDVNTQNPDGTYQDVLFKSIEHLFYGSASAWTYGVDRELFENSNMYVVNIAQILYGDKIQPESFILGTPYGALRDNGLGEFYISGSCVGHIFYGLGIAVFRHSEAENFADIGIGLNPGDDVTVTFNATHTIYEHSIMCSIDMNELNYTTNPSILIDDLDGNVVADSFASGTLTPYMTTIGLYNNLNQLVAVAKFPRPIKRAPESQQTVIIKFDV